MQWLAHRRVKGMLRAEIEKRRQAEAELSQRESGRGTIFAAADVGDLPTPARGGTETILVVEDEIPVREFVSRLLRENGYEVFAAGSGIEALSVWREERERIDLLLTDMVMPDGFSGAELARRLRRENPRLTIVYTSGYSMDFVERKLVLMPGINFLQKPYMPADLIRTVRENLDRESVIAG